MANKLAAQNTSAPDHMLRIRSGSGFRAPSAWLPKQAFPMRLKLIRYLQIRILAPAGRLAYNDEVSNASCFEERARGGLPRSRFRLRSIFRRGITLYSASISLLSKHPPDP